MKNVQGYITIDSVVNDYLDESEQSNHKYFKIWQLAFRGMEQLGLDFFYQVKSVKLPVDATNQTVLLPADYINYTKIGVLNDRGEVIPLIFNQKMTTYADLTPTRDSQTQDTTLFDYYSPESPVFFNFWDGIAYGNIYGIPSGSPFVGNFNIDVKNSLILLNENFFYNYIILEYIASPVETEEYYIPLQFREALIAYLAWKDIANMPTTRKGNLGDKRDRRHEYYNERRLAMSRYKPLYLEETFEMAQMYTRLAVKS